MDSPQYVSSGAQMEYWHHQLEDTIVYSHPDTKIAVNDPNLRQELLGHIIMQNLSKFLTPKQRTQYCVIFGTRVLSSHDNLREAQSEVLKYKSNHLSVSLYIPNVLKPRSTEEKEVKPDTVKTVEKA